MVSECTLTKQNRIAKSAQTAALLANLKTCALIVALAMLSRTDNVSNVSSLGVLLAIKIQRNAQNATKAIIYPRREFAFLALAAALPATIMENAINAEAYTS